MGRDFEREALQIRAAGLADLPDITAIYNHYVLHGHASFDTQPRTAAEADQWFSRFATLGPHRLLVALSEQEILGWAGSSPYRSHPAFARTVETSIYLAPARQHQGIGSALYARLFEILANEPVHLALAGIALPNPGSIQLHQRFGFSEVGVFQEYACKHGEYISSVWLQKLIQADMLNSDLKRPD